MSVVEKFPISTWKRILNKRGARAVNCVVSGRYLQFGKLGAPAEGYFPEQDKIGTPVAISVMTSSDVDTDDRKICEIVVTLEELRNVLSKLEADSQV